MGSEVDPAMEIRVQTQPRRRTIQELSTNEISGFVPIRPKPVINRFPSQPINLENVSRHIKRSERARESRRGAQEWCNIPQCLILNCKLRTHRRLLKRFDTNPLPAKGYTQQTGSSNTNSRAVVQNRHLLPQGAVEWFPKLPFEKSEEPEFRELFHHFTITQYDIIDALLHPPPFTDSGRRHQANFKQWNFQTAMSNPVYSLNFITWTHYRLSSQRISCDADRTTAKLHYLVMKYLRTELENYTPEKIRELIPIIMTLAILDLTVGRYDALSFHRNAAKHIVAASGGFHNLGDFIFYAENLDQMLSTVTGLPPLFSSMPTRGLERPLRRPQVYGAAFDSRTTIGDLDEDVLYYCSGICRAIEILEANNLDFNPENRTDLVAAGTDIHYFWFLRSHLHVLYNHVQSWEFPHNPKSQFVLLATKIVDYMVLMNNYIAGVPARIAERLQQMLEHEDLEHNWADWQDVLIWMFFVVNMVEGRKGSKAWTLKSLILLLNKRYGPLCWPPSWRDLELRKLRTFAWSHKCLDKRFRIVCDTMQHTTWGTAG